MQADFPEIEKVVQFMSPVSILLQLGEKRFQQDNLLFMDSTAFDVFSWKMVHGDAHTALLAPYSIVLTKTAAQKFFGNENPVGKVFRAYNRDNLTVTGIMEDVPARPISTSGNCSPSFRAWRSLLPVWAY
jgi:putative ABC transport system permease protein